MTEVATPLALVGFVDPALSMLELFLKREKLNFSVVPPAQAEAIIYNADQPIALESQHENYIKNYNKPGIVVSIQDLSWGNMIALKKPYSQQQLEVVLGQLNEQLSLGKNPACGSEEQSQQDHQQVVAQFQQQLRRGQGEFSTDIDLIRAQSDRRKEFQQQFLTRKRSAEQILEQLRAGVLAESYASPAEPTPDPTPIDISATTEDLLIEPLQTMEFETEKLLQQPAPEPMPLLELKSASEHEIRDCCGNSPDLNLSVRSQRRRVIFNPEGQLLAIAMMAMQRAHQEETAVAITGVPNLQLVYEPDCGKFYSGIDDDFLVQMAHVRFKFGELKLKIVGAERMNQMHLETDFAYYPANQLLWKLACWSSRGRVIGEIDLAACYQLESRPDPSVLIGLPHTEKFIELWLEQPLTAQQVMDMTGAKQRYVFPFMTAAWVLKWLRRC